MSNHLDMFDEKDLVYESPKPKGAGGQHVAKYTYPIVVTHAPTGISASCTTERSQHLNREKAVWEIMLRLEELDNHNAKK